MECDNCKGTGETATAGHSKTARGKCLICNGYGEMCDICGEATGEPGMNICARCAAEKDGEP